MNTKPLLAASFVALVTASGADAQMMGPGTGMPGYFSNGTARASSMYSRHVDMRVVASSWLADLRLQLAITPAQDAAWLAFANAVTALSSDMEAHRTQMLANPAATAPQRADLAEYYMERHLAALRAVSDALDVLYAQLTPAQRTVLDQGYAAACGAGGLFGG